MLFDLSKEKSVKVGYTGMCGVFNIGKVDGRIYRNVVYSTMARSNIPVYDLLFDLGEKKLVKVHYTKIWYIIPPWENISLMVEYAGI